MEWKAWSEAYKNLDSQNKQGAPEGSIWEIKGNIFVSRKISQMKGNLHVSVSEAN